MVARSASVGAVATLADLAVLGLLVEIVGLSARLANAPGLLTGTALQFVGNKWFAFRDPSPRWARQGTWFALVQIVALGLNLGLFDLLVVAGVHFAVARLASSALVYFAFCLPLWSRIFRTPATSEES